MEIKIKISESVWEVRYFLSETSEILEKYLNDTYGVKGINWDNL